ncbi:hypothetical protein EPO66_03100 [bacterium]|nr:MAG: hypothetical protein EPO66_03100 [bacterium]
MQGKSGFFKTSSVVVKTAAWVFFFLGLIGGVSMILGAGLEYPRWMGFIILPVYTFISFCLYLLAEIAKSMAKIIGEEKNN